MACTEEDEAEDAVPTKTVAMLEEIKQMMMMHKQEQFDLSVENSDSHEAVREMFDRFHDNSKDLVDAVELMAWTFAKRERAWQERLERERFKQDRLADENLQLAQKLQRFQLESGSLTEDFAGENSATVHLDEGFENKGGKRCEQQIQNWSTQMRSKRSSSSSSILDTVSAWTSKPSEVISSAASKLQKTMFEWQLRPADSLTVVPASSSHSLQDDVVHWSKCARAKHVTFGSGAQSTTASYKYNSDGEPKAVTLGGFVVTAAKLPVLSANCVGFAVHVRKCNQDWDDGLAIGVTSHPPEDWQAILAGGDNLPQTADAVTEVWLAGFDGEYFEMHGEKPNSVEIEWKPSTLTPGDVVAVLVSPEQQQFQVFVNSRRVVDVPSKLPACGVPLYGVVDLLGTADVVELLSSEELRQLLDDTQTLRG